MIKYLTAALIAMTAAAGAQAADIIATPGQLSAQIADAAAETALTVSGTVNAADLQYISTSMPALRTLDLSRATITDYDGEKLMGYRHHPANSIPATCFAASPITHVALPAGIYIGDGAFASSALTAVNVPADCRLGAGVFADCRALASATVPAAPAGTFSGCVSLTAATVAHASAIGASAFAGCTALNSITAQNVSTIGNGAFADCTSLTTFPFGPSLKAVGARAFARSGLAAADMAQTSGPLTVGAWAFVDCRSLSQLTLPTNINLGHGAFFGCRSLTALYPRNYKEEYAVGLPKMPDYAFAGTAALDANTLMGPDVDSLGRYVLAGNTGTESIFLPGSLRHLGDGAMAGMTSLKAIHATAHEEVPTLGNDVWAGVSQNEITLNLSNNVANAFMATPQWNAFHIDIVTNLEENIAADMNLVRGRFAGTDIEVDLGTVDASQIALYDLAGQCLARVAPTAQLTVLPTAAYATRTYLVVVQLKNGSQLSLKLMR